MNGLLATMRRRYVELPTLSCIFAYVHLGRHAVTSDFVGYEVDPLDVLKSAPSSYLWPSVNSSSAVFCSSINCNEYSCMRHRELRVHDSLLHSIIAYASFQASYRLLCIMCSIRCATRIFSPRLAGRVGHHAILPSSKTLIWIWYVECEKDFCTNTYTSSRTKSTS